MLAAAVRAQEKGPQKMPIEDEVLDPSQHEIFYLAARGMTRPHRVLEGPYGYYPLFEGSHDVAGAIADLGRVWRIAEVSHKPVPGGRATHGAVEGLLTLMAREDFDAMAVDSVEVETTPLVHRLCGRPDIDDPSPNYALLCIPYCGAVALCHGGGFPPTPSHRPGSP